ncbi:hypothetical protein [Streptomyces sp. RPT161]|uniref:hypothetical protein n=1 Tax=Streptomyces sp. RPT161 TaxID=3015993 RepID=UPI003FCD8387
MAEICVSGKKKQKNIKKPTVTSDSKGRLLRTWAIRPGRMHDHTADPCGQVKTLRPGPAG